MKKIIFFVMLIPAILFSESNDKTLSPYFLVKTNIENPKIEVFPLQSTNVNIKISGVIADVIIEQSYKNQGTVPIEAVYTFPASTKASIYSMTMTVDDRIIKAKIKKKEEAKQQYEQAKNEGKSASLLVEERPNVFTMNVANIMPGDVIKIELKYTEMVVPTEGIYEFIYPTVVGPRYSNDNNSKNVTNNNGNNSQNIEDKKWVANPYLHEGEKVPYNLFLNINLISGIPISKIFSSTHKLDIKYLDKNRAEIKLTEEEKESGNKDFVLQYALNSNKIQSGLMLYKGEEENYFLLELEPPIRSALQKEVKREYIFVMDVSGSMSGYPISVSKKLINNLLNGLNENDRFNILFFSGNSSVLSEKKSIPVTKSNIRMALQMVSSIGAGGGTEILPALQKALSLSEKDEEYSTSIIIITDGYVDVEYQVFDLLNKNLGSANVFPFGVGTSVNRFLIEGMAHIGKGEPFVIINEKESDEKVELFRKYINSPILTGIDVKFEDFDVFDVEPQYIPDLFADRPLLIYGKWKGALKGTIKINGFSGDGVFENKINIADSIINENNKAIKYLWARKRIEQITDYTNISENNQKKEDIINLSLKYNILSKYTSFIAVDEIVRNKDKKIEEVKQPLPLPDKVTDKAVGMVPEPQEWMLIFILVFVIFYLFRKNVINLLTKKK